MKVKKIKTVRRKAKRYVNPFLFERVICAYAQKFENPLILNEKIHKYKDMMLSEWLEQFKKDDEPLFMD